MRTHSPIHLLKSKTCSGEETSRGKWSVAERDSQDSRQVNWVSEGEGLDALDLHRSHGHEISLVP